MTIEFHRRERKERREKTLFVVKEKDYLTQRRQPRASGAYAPEGVRREKNIIIKRNRQYEAERKQKTVAPGKAWSVGIGGEGATFEIR